MTWSLPVRRLRGDDTALMQVVNEMFGDVFEGPESYHARRPSADYLRRLLEGDQVIVLAALDGDVVVGGLAAYVLQKFEQERSEVYIYDLAVRETHRRQGIATALIETLSEEARMLSAYVLYVQADRGDEPAIALYTKLGTREDVLHFDIDVPA